MELQPETSKALDKWLGPETWYTNHDLDMGRFYDFVDRYAAEHGYVIDETALAEEIVRRLKQKRNVNEALEKIVETRLILAYNILDFLKRTQR